MFRSRYPDRMTDTDFLERWAARWAPRGTSDPLTLMQELDSGAVERAHLTYVSERLQQAISDVEQGINRKMIVSLPPRHGKSTLCSIYLPTWVLSLHPNWNCGIASYGATLAERSGREVRRLVEANPQLNIKIASDLRNVSQWETNEHGGIIARGVGSGLTGFGVRVLVVDDPFKDFMEAHSPVTRQAVWEWWLSVALTRLEGPYLLLVIQTRWHEDDLIGRILSEDYEGDPAEWEVIRIPAIADSADDPLGRELGEPLFAPFTDETAEEALERWTAVKASVGSYVWAALYQQRPAPPKGQVVDVNWWKWWTPELVTEDSLLRHFDTRGPGRWLTSWDCAFKANADSDLVVGQVWCIRGADRYLVDQVRGRWTFSQTLEQIKGLAARYPYCNEHLVEDKANGPAIIDVLKRSLPGVIPYNPGQDSKLSRAQAVAPVIEAGNVFLPSRAIAPWVDDFVSEFRFFPHGANDDQVDACTQALNRVRTTSHEPVVLQRASGQLPM